MVRCSTLRDLNLSTHLRLSNMKKRHGNYNKRATKKQMIAQKRNFAIFRLRGMLASLDNIMYSGGLDAKTNLHLFNAKGSVRDALVAETGK